MDVQAWHVLAGLTALLVVYAISAAVLNVPVSVVGFLTAVFFLGVGLALGRLLSRSLS